MTPPNTESRVFGSDVWQMTDGLFDNPHTALMSIDAPVIDIEPQQTICLKCRLVFWQPLGYCPTCRLDHEGY